jgi:hypothetical protein
MSITTIPPFDVVVPIPWGSAYGYTSHTLNAAAEMQAVCGYLHLEGGSGTKTLSAAGGGSIIVIAISSTFATASTEIRVGLEDIASTSLPDTTQDVYGAKIAGTDTITASAYNTFAMTSGTKTVSHGDRLAVTIRMPTRAGADAVAFGSQTWLPHYFINHSGLPYGVNNGTTANDFLWAFLQFDDGTTGWIKGTPIFTAVNGTIAGTLDAGDSPDEYCGTFTVSVPTQIEYIGWAVEDDNAAGEDYELILYSDPLGTPVALQTVAVDADAITFESASVHWVWVKITATTLQPGTTYGIAFRPTAGSFTIYWIEFSSSANEKIKRMAPYVQNIKFAGRTNQTGAFTETQTYHAPIFGFSVNGLDDGTGGGSGGSFTFVG